MDLGRICPKTIIKDYEENISNVGGWGGWVGAWAGGLSYSSLSTRKIILTISSVELRRPFSGLLPWPWCRPRYTYRRTARDRDDAHMRSKHEQCIWKKNTDVANCGRLCAQESYKNQIDALNESYEKEEQRRAEADENYKNTVEKIEKDYLKEKRKLNSKERKRLKELLESSPDDLDHLIEEEFGFEKVWRIKSMDRSTRRDTSADT